MRRKEEETMKSSFPKGRVAAASMAARTVPPKNKVPDRKKTPSSPRKSRLGVDKDVTGGQGGGLGMAIAVLLGRRGLRQGDLARLSGIKPSLISGYIQGRKIPRPSTLQRIATAVDVRAEEIHALAAVLDRSVNSPRAARWALEAAELLSKIGTALLAQRLSPPVEEEAQALWMRLKPWSANERRTIVMTEEKFQISTLCELVCRESIASAADCADEALARAQLAELIARMIRGTEEWCFRLQGYTWFFLGNALRVKGRLAEADDAFYQANRLWTAGAGGDPERLLNEALVLDLEASLRREQRRLPEALDLLDRALAADRRSERTGRILINRAKTLEEMGLYEDAIDTLRRAEPYIDEEREPRSFWALLFNLSEYLYQVGRPAEADPLLPKVEELTRRLGNDLDQVRFLWLKGRIAAAQGNIEHALDALERVKTRFADLKIPYDTALVSLELAVFYLQQNRTEEVKELAREMVEIFRAQKVDREAIAAALLFRDAAERERATAHLARRLADYLKRVRSEPGLRFEG